MKSEERFSKRLLVEQGKAIEAIFGQAVRHALLLHKQAGNSIAGWRDNQVILIPAEEIVVPDDVASNP